VVGSPGGVGRAGIERALHRARRHPWVVGAVLLLAVYAALLWWDAASLGNVHTGDTDNLVAGARLAADCIHTGQWTGCGKVPDIDYTLVFPYPLLQYIPAIVLVRLDLADPRIVELLARLNLVAFVATVGMAAFALRRDRRLAGLAVAAVLASSATYQATAGFSEMLSAATVLAAVVAARERRVLLIGPAFALAAVGKETLPPFLLLLGLVAARTDDDGWLPPIRLLGPMVGGIVAGGLASIAFNIFRFDSPRNLLYLDPLLRTPGTGRKAGFLIAQWLSPSAGIAWFWPLATLILCGVLAVAVRRFVADRRAVRSWGPPLVVVGTVVGFTAGLTFWFTPFGWIAYGPRLAVPILPAGVVLGLSVAGDDLLAALSHLRPVAVRALLVVAVVAACWPQTGAPWRHGEAVQELIAGDDECPGLIEYPIQQDVSLYYRCTTHLMWRLHPALLDDVATGGGAPAYAGRLAAAGFVAIAMAGALRARSARDGDGQPGIDAGSAPPTEVTAVV
jgi:hypothetical protein